MTSTVGVIGVIILRLSINSVMQVLGVPQDKVTKAREKNRAYPMQANRQSSEPFIFGGVT